MWWVRRFGSSMRFFPHIPRVVVSNPYRFGCSFSRATLTTNNPTVLSTKGPGAPEVVVLVAKLFAALTIVFWTHEYVIDFCPAIGPSMYPLVEGCGDLLVFERMSCWMSELPSHVPWLKRFWSPWIAQRLQLHRGDVVIAMSVDSTPVKICKRVVALEDDLLVFSESSPPSFQATSAILSDTSTPQTFKIPQGMVWLQGDNVTDSYDSRHYGPVPTANILGRVLCRIWPLWKFRWITKDTTPAALQKQYIQRPIVDVGQGAYQPSRHSDCVVTE